MAGGESRGGQYTKVDLTNWGVRDPPDPIEHWFDRVTNTTPVNPKVRTIGVAWCNLRQLLSPPPQEQTMRAIIISTTPIIITHHALE